MGETDRITFRCPAKLRKALESTAAKKGFIRTVKGKDVADLGAYLRHLSSKATGVEVDDLPQGFAAVGPRKLKQASKKGVKARWG